MDTKNNNTYNNSNKGSKTDSANASNKPASRFLPPDSGKDHRGGRPRLPDGEKKSRSYTAHATPIQSAVIEMKREKAGMTKSEFTLSALMSARVVARLPRQVMKWVRDIAGMANNFNQLAKEAHTYGFYSVHDRLSHLASDIEELITFIRSYPEHDEEAEDEWEDEDYFMYDNDRKEDGR